MAPSPSASAAPSKDDNEAVIESPPPVKESAARSPRVFSPAQRTNADFAARLASESESEREDETKSPDTKRLKRTGEEDEDVEEEKEGVNEGNDDEESEDEVEEVEPESNRHEIDAASDDELDGEEEADEEEEALCADCGETPCRWLSLGHHVVDQGKNRGWLDDPPVDYDVSKFDDMDEEELAEVNVEHKHRRHESYATLNFFRWDGGRGRHNRVKHSSCCVDRIVAFFPPAPGYQRAGFRSARGDESDGN